MPLAILTAMLLLCAACSQATAGTILPPSQLKAITVESRRDGIPSGWCGRAMLSLLKKSGLGDGLKGGNGQDWENILSTAGWKPVRVSSPNKAPLGSVLVYLGDRRVGKRPRGTPGGYHGHVEMVALCDAGGRIYVADNPRRSPGGTVPDNFTGRAWVPPRTLPSSPPPVSDQVEVVLQERFKMAQSHFTRGSGDLVQLESAQGGLRPLE